MDFLYSVFFAAGIAAVAYTKLGKRAGYGNAQQVWAITGVAFVASFLVFLIFTATVIHLH